MNVTQESSRLGPRPMNTPKYKHTNPCIIHKISKLSNNHVVPPGIRPWSLVFED